MFTDDFINKLITEEKIITEPQKRDFKEENQHLRNDFQLTSSDGFILPLPGNEFC